MDQLDSQVFYKKLLRVAIPITLQNLIQTLVNMIDSIMIGQLGENAIAAVGIGNQYYFLMSLMMFGVVGGGTVLAAQYWGNRDIDNINKVVGLGLLSTVALTVIFTIGAFAFPAQILKLFSKDAEVITMGVEYLRAVAPSYVFNAITLVFVFSLRSMGTVMISTITTLLACLVNIVCNYAFIFGNFGFAPMGAAGAGLGTLVARIVETGALVGAIYLYKMPIAVHPRKWLAFDKAFVKEYYRLSIPVILNETVWAVGIMMHNFVYGQLGTASFAAIQIAGTIEKLCIVFFFGVGNGASILIGNLIGRGEEELAYLYAKRFIKINVLLSFVACMLLLACSPFIGVLFKVSEEVLLYAKYIIYVVVIFMIPRMGNYINVVGILRSGGDTKTGLMMDMSNVWLIGTPAAFIAGLIFQLPIYWVYFAVNIGEIGIYIYGLLRVKSKKWINNLTT